MWLSGQSKPDHNTINDFRGKRLQGHFKKIFHQVVLLLVEQGVISLKDIFVDGTKIEANANRYTFVWGKSIKTSKERIKTQLKSLWSYVEKVYKDEQHIPNTPDFEAIDADKIEATINQINEALQGKEVDKKIKQKLNYTKKNWPTNMAKYQKQAAILKARNSYSKTHNDTTFMRMKDHHMQNGFEQELHRYQAQNCEGCSLRSLCHKAKTNRIIERNYNLIRLKSKAKALLTSQQGIAKRKQRCWDVEAVFGNIKQNMNFKRFMLRGIDKVNVEIGLIAMAHNLKKYSLAI